MWTNALARVALATLLLGFGAAALGAGPSCPARGITLVVGYAPGGGIDVNARLLAGELARYFDRPVIVENRPGAGSRIANDYVARSAPDGCTLLVNTAAMAIDMAFGDKPGTQALRELKPVSTIASTPIVLIVHPSVAARSVRDLVALARAQPGRMNYASSGPGTTGHLYGELFKLRTGTDIVHVPFKGTAPALTALMGGEVEMSFVPLPGVLAQLQAGTVRALATTGAKRSALLPDVPTMTEAGVPDADASTWYGVLAPSATPRETVDLLARAIADVSREHAFAQRLLELGEEPVITPTQQFDALLRHEVERWGAVIKAAGIRTE
jgi:tripartite-type tricarboxylate transporter receptor subunit TctC